MEEWKAYTLFFKSLPLKSSCFVSVYPGDVIDSGDNLGP